MTGDDRDICSAVNAADNDDGDVDVRRPPWRISV